MGSPKPKNDTHQSAKKGIEIGSISRRVFLAGLVVVSSGCQNTAWQKDRRYRAHHAAKGYWQRCETGRTPQPIGTRSRTTQPRRQSRLAT